MIATDVLAILSRKRFIFSTEKDVQAAIDTALAYAAAPFKREVVLDGKNIIDFMVDNVGIEVKIKGVKADIYKQLERYSKFDNIHELILMTSKSMGIPPEINGKPVYVINMSKAWL